MPDLSLLNLPPPQLYPSTSLPQSASSNITTALQSLNTSAALPLTFIPYCSSVESNKIHEVSEQGLNQMSLRKWVSSNNIGVNAVNQLLKMLQPHHSYLPSNCRNLMKTPRETVTMKLLNGEMFYTGILHHIIIKLKCGLRPSTDTILLQVNIDGLPLFKSSSLEFYPILGLCSNCDDQLRFTIACFCGAGKPQPLQTYLRPFLDEIKQLRETGILFDGIKYGFDIQCFICDAPARSYLKGTVGHTSKHACERCLIVGQYKNHRINFSNSEKYLPIEDKYFEMEQKMPFIKSESPLLEINVRLVTQFPLDIMHLVFLGVRRRILLVYYVQGIPPYKLSQNQIRAMNSTILVMKNYQPSEFARKCRTLFELKRWKATEYRSFLLYYGVTLLRDILPVDQFSLFLLLHTAIFILSSDSLIRSHIDEAQNFLEEFVTNAPNILGEDFVVYNVHSLLHIVDDVRKYGPVTKYSAFPFENYLFSLKLNLRSKKHVLQQLHRRLVEKDQNSAGQSYTKDDRNHDFRPTCKYNEIFDSQQNLLSYNCKKIYFTDYVLTESLPDNCVLLVNGKVCIIQKIHVSQTDVSFEGVTFTHMYNLYTSPILSSKLNIFYCKGVSENNATSFSRDKIRYKGWQIPYKEGFAIFPLLHSNFFNQICSVFIFLFSM